MSSSEYSSSWVSQWLSSQRTQGPKFGDAAASYRPLAAPSPRKPFTFSLKPNEDEDEDWSEPGSTYIICSSQPTISCGSPVEYSSSSSSSTPESTPSPTLPTHTARNHPAASSRSRRHSPSQMHRQSLESIREEQDADD